MSPVWRAFIPFIADVRSPLYASEGGDLAEATLWLFFFCFDGAGSFALLCVEDPLATLAVLPTIFSSPREQWV